MGEDEVRQVVRAHVRSVMALREDSLSDDTRFDEDLHADSLDLVEIVESVEQDLADRGVDVALTDADVLGLRTLGDAVRVLTRQAAGRPG